MVCRIIIFLSTLKSVVIGVIYKNDNKDDKWCVESVIEKEASNNVLRLWCYLSKAFCYKQGRFI